jgi:hypothetical protein
MVNCYDIVISGIAIPGNVGGWKKLLASWAVATLAELELHRAHHAAGRVYRFSEGAGRDGCAVA